MSTILVCGGGTGGHVFPGLAVARALRALADVEVVFAGSPRGLESKIVPAQGFRLELLDIEPMKGGGPSRAIRGALVAAKAMRHAARLIASLEPKVVLSVGGYAAGPTALAGVRMRVPLAVLEPNSVLGLANRLLAPFASRAYVAWHETAKNFRADKARVLGVPLRAGFVPAASRVRTEGAPRRVLVLGGSQGATALNERIPGALGAVARRLGALDVLHQTGEGREEGVRAAYARAGLTNATVQPFVEDVARHMTETDLIVARAGAVTVAEIAAVGRASLLVPFPHAADDHQAKNALALAALGAATCLRQEEATDARLEAELGRLLGDDVARDLMAERAREHGRPSAADDIARDLLALAKISLKKTRMNGGGKTNGASGHHPVAPDKELS